MTTPYGKFALAGEVGKMRLAREGARNTTLNTCWLKVCHSINVGAIDYDEGYRMMYDAALSTGLPHDEIVRTMASAEDGARRDPRYRPSPTSFAHGRNNGPPTLDDLVHGVDGATSTVSSWRPVDLGHILDGTYTPPTPTVGARRDGIGLLYPGRRHSAYGESESGKTWLALVIAAHELAAGQAVAYLDFEDEAGATVTRLLALGADPSAIRHRFCYIGPAEAVTLPGNTELLTQVLGDLKPTLGVIDGVTEAMTMHELNLKDNIDVARFGRLISARIAAAGAAALELDHVVKDPDGRGRYAIGGQHKLAGLNGAAFLLHNRQPFGVGLAGLSTVYVTKDRPAQVRRHATRTEVGGQYRFADLIVEPLTGDLLSGALLAPDADGATVQRPTVLMARVSAALDKAGRPLSGREITDRVPGKVQYVRLAIACLVDEGYVTVEPGPRNSQMHTLARPFDHQEKS